ncbi:hypothetical protein BGM26_15845 [Bacillus sp. FJAT-29790]|uniref:DL-endopeptidase inhibitor IseA family protein n=1 Tax=Bacillus sp. FJAT-29790 TaxID=1895002 RepID=UPI001C24699A|nr:DL-endopeptidase inhibitor IseA family protein [Bacillus sp. FJAT-29790]MBU8880426.1 hypothetical protein [Bacillus sp. FJAT-29790]
MKKQRASLISLVVAGTLVLGGCNFLPEPTSLIQAPAHASADSEINQSLDTLAKRYLPKGTELSIPNAPIGASAVLSADFEGDGQKEVVVLYHSKDAENQVGAFVLKKKKGNWEKVFAKKGSGYEISWASVADVTGDGKNELLLGWKVGSLAGNVLEIYTWEKEGFKILQKINYHQLEEIRFSDEPMTRLAVWKKDIGDAYDIELLKWEKDRFVADEAHYPSYFPKAVKYYEGRTEAVPNAAYYWYYLADAQLKANHPELAYSAVTKGMENKMVVPSYDKFAELKETIEAKLSELGNDIQYEIRDARIHLAIPKEIAPYVMIEEESGPHNNYIVSAFVSPKQREKQLLFAVEIYAKDMIQDRDEIGLESLAETEQFLYYVKRNNEEFIHHKDSSTYEIYEKAFALKDKIIQSIKPGSVYPIYSSREEETVIQMTTEAVNKYWYVVRGGEMPEGHIESFPINGLDYRYMGSDLDTKSKLVNYLSESYAYDSIQSYIKRAGIVEHNGILAQPNADGGSIASYDKATVVQSTGNGIMAEFDLKVPLGDSLIYEFIHIEFQKTEDGWRISSDPGTF